MIGSHSKVIALQKSDYHCSLHLLSNNDERIGLR